MMCLCRLVLTAERKLHRGHWKGFSPVWMRRWRRRSQLLRKALLQMWQTAPPLGKGPPEAPGASIAYGGAPPADGREPGAPRSSSEGHACRRRNALVLVTQLSMHVFQIG